MWRLGCVAIAMIVMGFWSGLQGLYTAATNWSPTETTCAEYATERPSATWLKITGCRADLLETVYEEALGGRIDKLWIPLLPDEAGDEAEAVIVLETEDRAVIGLFQKVLDQADSADESTMVSALLEVMTSDALTSFEGTVSFGWDLDDDDRDQVASLGERLVDDFVIVAHGSKPSMLYAMVMIGVGCAGVLLLVLMIGAAARSE